LFKPWEYSSGQPPHTIEWYQIELRQPGRPALPVAIEPGDDGGYLVRPKSDLPVGDLEISLVSDCPGYGDPPDELVEPRRVIGPSFRVVPASPLPTEVGVATLVGVSGPNLGWCDPNGWRVRPPPSYIEVRLHVTASAELRAFGSVVALEARANTAPKLRKPVYLDGSGIQVQLERWGPDDAPTCGPNLVEIHAQIPGYSVPITPARLMVDIDCSQPTCEPDASPDPIGLNGCLGDAGPDVCDARPDADEPASSAQPAVSGCSCRSAPGSDPVAAQLLGAALLALAVTRRRR
jgi:MYXO-CTERM domain-containing protein